jgi:hypothetical protein
MGRATIRVIRQREVVPTMQGRIPPAVMESLGDCVKKSHEIARHPLDTIKYRINRRAAPFRQAAVLKDKKKTFCAHNRCFFIIRMPLPPV